MLVCMYIYVMMRIGGAQRHTSMSNPWTDKVNVPAFLGRCSRNRRQKFVIGHATVASNGEPDLCSQCEVSTGTGSLGACDGYYASAVPARHNGDFSWIEPHITHHR
jgi:hypothetical protein